MSRRVPVGVEKVLYLAATDEGFRQALMEDRARAVQQRGLSLRDSELALLAAVPDPQLRVAIDGMDTTPRNVQRRTFMRVVAASAATVAAAEALGCSDDNVATGIRPDMGDDANKIEDAGEEAGKDGVKDTVQAPKTEGMAGTGIRPGG